LTTAADSSLLSNGEIIFSIILALTLFGEKLDHIGYVAMAFVSTNLEFDMLLLKVNAGNLLVIGATLFWGLDNNISRILSHRMDITRIIQLKSFIGGFILLVLCLLLGIPVN
jgi:drug/metabolite transporter (DMT)-like permease